MVNEDFNGVTPHVVPSSNIPLVEVDGEARHPNEFREDNVLVSLCVESESDLLVSPRHEVSLNQVAPGKRINPDGFERTYKLLRSVNDGDMLQNDGRVRHGYSYITRKHYAIKCVPLRERGEYRTDDPIQEAAVYHHIKQSLIQENEGIEEFIDRTHLMLAEEFLVSETFFYIVMPFCDGGTDLFNHIAFAERQRLERHECGELVRDLLTGLDSLQKARVCHRDINVENCLVYKKNGTYRLVIIDFGMSLLIPYSEGRVWRRLLIDRYSNRNLPLSNLMIPKGKSSTRPPEVSYCDKFDGHAVDTFAVAPIIYTMLTGENIFGNGKEALYTCDRYRQISGGLLCDIVDLDPDTVSFLQSCMWFKPECRLSLQGIREHPWIQNL